MYIVVHTVEHLLNKRVVKLCRWPVPYNFSVFESLFVLRQIFESSLQWTFEFARQRRFEFALQRTFEKLPASLAFVNVSCPGVFMLYQTINTS